ncbi:hypothetical protein IW262DRAFT_1332969 [Armillaria fumosa]|nr:hypothetical protein IW262DRAFT_1332969 [Armillaria fumosa]
MDSRDDSPKEGQTKITVKPVARYCSPECQKSHWCMHQADCGPGHCPIRSPHSHGILHIRRNPPPQPRHSARKCRAHFIHVHCTLQPNGIGSYLLRLSSGGPEMTIPNKWSRTVKSRKCPRKTRQREPGNKTLPFGNPTKELFLLSLSGLRRRTAEGQKARFPR